MDEGRRNNESYNPLHSIREWIPSSIQQTIAFISEVNSFRSF